MKEEERERGREKELQEIQVREGSLAFEGQAKSKKNTNEKANQRWLLPTAKTGPG